MPTFFLQKDTANPDDFGEAIWGLGGSMTVAIDEKTLDIPESSWSEPSLLSLDESGTIARVTLRSPVGAGEGTVNFLIWESDTEPPPGFDPATVPEEDRIVFIETTTVEESAVVASLDSFLLGTALETVYSRPLYVSVQDVTAPPAGGFTGIIVTIRSKG